MSTKQIKSFKYPDPASTLSFNLKPKKEIADSCYFVLDANILILPYTAGAQSLQEISKVYKNLAAQKRLFIPAQAAREFLDNRATKISDAHELLSKKQNQNFQLIESHPLLEEIPEFKSFLDTEKELKLLLKKYRSQISETMEVIKSWGWDDPVSKIYHEILATSVLDDSDLDMTEIEKDLKIRNQFKIPPGYKDSAKDENQIGDLLIWQETLNLAKANSKDVIFVSGDEKNDWWHQSGGRKLYPRFELVDEFRRITNGKSFHIVSLSELLQMFHAKTEVIDEIKTSETLAKTIDKTKKYNDTIKNAKTLIRDLRERLRQYRDRRDWLSHKRFDEIHTGDETTKNSNWNKYNLLDAEASRDLLEYYEGIKIDIIMHRDFISSVFPEIASWDKSFLYNSPTNPIGVGTVVDDFERIVKEFSARIAAQDI
ncbi:PIN domain-containing protein [Pseudomonas mosselii]|uniref:PIN domain-containing protein n=1 Tax=Pseudomonas mosselii TaxID=78327 RepID=UPI002DBF69DB|nr:PIN domain-containing protein [Pseudomonas mosselii]MEB5930967.1 PIN domain-containing protein [Pseudomonas mosselii]